MTICDWILLSLLVLAGAITGVVQLGCIIEWVILPIIAEIKGENVL